MYRFQVEALRGNYRCITFDFRGQGQSPADVRGSMRALRGVLDRQGIADQLGSIRTPTLVVSGRRTSRSCPIARGARPSAFRERASSSCPAPATALRSSSPRR